jgi:hypothetical protein
MSKNQSYGTSTKPLNTYRDAKVDDHEYQVSLEREKRHPTSFTDANKEHWQEHGSMKASSAKSTGSNDSGSIKRNHNAADFRADEDDNDFEESSKHPASFAKDLHSATFVPRRSPRGHDPDFRYMVEQKMAGSSSSMTRSVKYRNTNIKDLVANRDEFDDQDVDGRSVKYRRRADHNEFDEDDDDDN